MFKYILKRILYFIPTFFTISLLCFIMGQVAPGDPVELLIKGNTQGGEAGQINEKLSNEKQYYDISEKLGRNLPTFYFSVTSKAYPDTLYKIPRAIERENLDRLVNNYGDWNKVSAYYSSLKRLEYAMFDVRRVDQDPTQFERIKNIKESCSNLYHSYIETDVKFQLDIIQKAANQTVTYNIDSTHKVTRNTMYLVKPLVDTVLLNYTALTTNVDRSALYMPTVHWNGFKNQYHRWMFGDAPWFVNSTDITKKSKGFLRGDFGVSYTDGRPVRVKIAEALPWTLLMNFVSFLIIYLIGIPMGVSLAVRKGSSYDRIVTTTNFILYSLPVFWVATMAIIFLTNKTYAPFLDLFPDHGVGKTGSDFGFFERVLDRAHHFALPIFCSLLGSFAYLSRQMRGGMLNVLRQDYIRTAFAKGLSNREVYWKHAFRNSLIPIITMFASFLPAMIGGSLIIEFIFTIPGMGQVSYMSIVSRDYPLLFTILMVSAILTMVGNLLADMLYGVIDPRISFVKKM
jgi:peptide/nickel transport system permease protein